MNDGFLQRRLIRPITDLLRQGVTPEKLALSLALGVALGVFPVLGSTTALCAVAAVALGLNLPAIQIVNYFVYPLQIALLIPFFRLGEWIFQSPHLRISVGEICAMIHADAWNAIRTLWTTTWHAMTAWCLAAPLFVPLAYGLFLVTLRRVWRREGPAASGVA